MKCEEIIELLDDYIDEMLPPEQRDLVSTHVSACASCRQELASMQLLCDALRNYPVKPSSRGFADNILRNARRAHNRGRPAMYMAAGAVAAGLMLLLVAGIVRMDADQAARPAAIQKVEMTVLEQRTISLAFNYPNAINEVTFILDLPEGIELSGYPEQRELVWKDALSNGKNVLQLTLMGKKPMSGSLKATIEHAGKRREFNIPLNVREVGASLTTI